eukprot:COSAG02_NODE_2321_length_9138_cov_11.428366_10_plen_57_part_00
MGWGWEGEGVRWGGAGEGGVVRREGRAGGVQNRCGPSRLFGGDGDERSLMRVDGRW